LGSTIGAGSPEANRGEALPAARAPGLFSRVILVIDNRDSFTFNLVQALLGLGAEVVVRRSDRLSLRAVRELRPERILVGPGPGGPAAAGPSLEVVRRLSADIPTLGVCLGHQVIGAAFGGRIGPARALLHGESVAVEHDGRGVFAGLPSPLRQARYNSLAVLDEGLPDCLEVSARASDGDVMGLRHKERPLEGVQFHPDSVLSERGSELLANFLRAPIPAAPSGVATARRPRGAARRPHAAGSGA
jgi:anthranilate synthase/aminodeoxychorismate synthase-like glutamine amidotransferase